MTFITCIEWDWRGWRKSIKVSILLIREILRINYDSLMLSIEHNIKTFSSAFHIIHEIDHLNVFTFSNKSARFPTLIIPNDWKFSVSLLFAFQNIWINFGPSRSRHLVWVEMKLLQNINVFIATFLLETFLNWNFGLILFNSSNVNSMSNRKPALSAFAFEKSDKNNDSVIFKPNGAAKWDLFDMRK